MTDALEPLTGVRKAMAGVMARSWSEIPHFAEIVLLDGAPLLARLEQERAAAPADAPRLSINDLVVYDAIQALNDCPQLNVLFVDGKLKRPSSVSVAVAVATDQGLMTPVIHDAQDMDALSVSGAIRDLSARAKAWKLAPAEFEGAVMTVSNLGAYGVDTGFPVINQRQTALLFIGSLIERPFVIDGQVVARPSVYVTLACDHRIIDGLTAAQYLGALRKRLEAKAGDDNGGR
jgi:pyruvate dehydrogenase E2 component (dihydrolipoamide acetyltransferase)